MKTPEGFAPVMKKCLMVAVFVAACVVAGEIMIRKAPNPYSIKHHYMMTHGKEVETLLLGSSHIFYGVNPAGFKDKTYNLANIIQGPELNYRLLKHYSKNIDGGSLKRIIMNICGVALFEPDLQLIRNQGSLSGYAIYMGLPDYNIPSLKYEIVNTSIYKHRLLMILKGKASVLADADSLGFGTQYALPADSVEVANSGMETANYQCTYPIEQINKNITYIDSIAFWCRKRGVELILLETPKYKTYNEIYSRKFTHVKDSVLRKFHGRFPEVRYYDFSADSRFDAGDFYDGNHLCRRGAEKFTKILADTLHL